MDTHAIPDPTSVRLPRVQAQYAADRRAAREVFGDAQPCAMGVMILNERPAGGGEADEPVLGDNRYPYLHFADQQVLRHRLLTPVQHVPDLAALRRSRPDAWTAFHRRADELRAAGCAVFVHGAGSGAMSVAAHVHAHVFELGDKLTRVAYDRASGSVEIWAGETCLVDEPNPAARSWDVRPWFPEPSACDARYEEVFGAPVSGAGAREPMGGAGARAARATPGGAA